MANIIQKNIHWLYTKVRSHLYKRDKDLWVFGEWFGNRCCDNSFSFANYLAKNYPHLQLVWIAKKSADTTQLAESIRIVEMDTPEAAEVLCHAGVAVMNQGTNDFTPEISFLCDGALMVNLWHGVPWKKIAMDMHSDYGFARRAYMAYLQKLQRADVYLALSDGFARILETAFYAPKKGIILAGYPRNAIFYDPAAVSAAREKVLSLLNVKNSSGKPLKLIAYMPTFRDNTEDVFSFEKLAGNSRLQEILEKHNAIIIQKAHFVSYQRNAEANQVKNSRILALNDIMAQELLAAADMLITDYSSCFFDYLVLDRPIIHYIYDYAYYAGEDRGVYYKAEDVVCGDAPETEEQLLAAMEANLADPGLRKELRKLRSQEHMTYESADSCEKIYREILLRL